MWHGLGFATKTVIQERFKCFEGKLSRAIMKGATKRLCFSCSPACWALAEDAATEHGLFSTSPLISKYVHPLAHHPAACGSIRTGGLWKLKPTPQQLVKRCLQQPALWPALAPLSGSHLGHFQLSEWRLFIWKFKPGAGSSHHPTSPSTLLLQHVARIYFADPAMFLLATVFPANSPCIPSGKPEGNILLQPSALWTGSLESGQTAIFSNILELFFHFFNS